MSVSQHNFREQLRRASEALARAEAVAGERSSGVYAPRGLTDAQLKQLKQGLLASARKHLAVAAQVALQNFESAGLPGLPQGRADDADAALREGQLAVAAAWSSLAEFETVRGDKDASIDAYRKALEITPDNIAANAQLADLLEVRHDLAGAGAHAARARRADPNNFIAAITLARVQMREGKFADAERAALAAANAPRAMVDDRALAWTLAGEARDRLDNTASAFKAFTQANALMRQRYGDLREQAHPAHPSNVRNLTQFVTVANAATWRMPVTTETPAPAFLIGFPRSGTTLLEQVLASHPKVTCLGETNILFEAMSVVLREGDLLDRIGKLTPVEIEAVRAAYRRMVLTEHPEAADHLIVDKHPLHIVLLPVINKFFPDAKIIFTERDPREVVLSCYQQCFGMNVATAQFLDLEPAAAYYDAVMELMNACRAKLPLELLEVRYRDIVGDLEKEARKIADFLGLPFDAAMLRYDQTARTRVITTPSARQVINPIYNRSVGRWRRYARELAPVLPLLNKWARRLGYEE